MTVVLMAILLIVTCKYLKWKLDALVLTGYMIKNGLPEPTDDEVGELTKWVLENVINDFKSKIWRKN